MPCSRPSSRLVGHAAGHLHPHEPAMDGMRGAMESAVYSLAQCTVYSIVYKRAQCTPLYSVHCTV
jgi:hypothetical protein